MYWRIVSLLITTIVRFAAGWTWTSSYFWITAFMVSQSCIVRWVSCFNVASIKVHYQATLPDRTTVVSLMICVPVVSVRSRLTTFVRLFPDPTSIFLSFVGI